MIPLEVIALSPYAREWAAEQARRSARRRFRDQLHRDIELGEWEPGDWAGLVSLYGSFDAARTAWARPPVGEERRAVWMEQLLSRGPSVVARAAGRIVGHAALVAFNRGDSQELVVFVHPDYRSAGIVTALVDALRRFARRQGVTTRALPATSPRRSTSWTRGPAALGAAGRTRLRAVVDAVRMVMIPLVCAIVIAVASEDPRGRALAIAMVFVSLGFGLLVNGRAIVGVRSRGSAPNV